MRAKLAKLELARQQRIISKIYLRYHGGLIFFFGLKAVKSSMRSRIRGILDPKIHQDSSKIKIPHEMGPDMPLPGPLDF